MMRYLLPMVLVLGCQPNLRGYQRCASDADCPQSYCLEAICAPAGSERISRDGGTEVDGGSAATPDAGDGGSATNPDAGDGGSTANPDAGGVSLCEDDEDCEAGSRCQDPEGICVETIHNESCHALYLNGDTESGTKTLRFGESTIETLCDQDDDNGGWQLMQRAVRGENLWDGNDASRETFGEARELPAITDELGDPSGWTFHIPFELIEDASYGRLTFRIVLYQYEAVERTVSKHFYQNLDRTVWKVGGLGQPFDNNFYYYATEENAVFEVCNGAVLRGSSRHAWGVYDITNPESCATYMDSGWLIEVDDDHRADLIYAPHGFEASTEWYALEVWVRPNQEGGVAPAP